MRYASRLARTFRPSNSKFFALFEIAVLDEELGVALGFPHAAPDLRD